MTIEPLPSDRPTIRRAFRTLPILALLTAPIACMVAPIDPKAVPDPPGPPAAVASITVNPSSAILEPGTSTTLTAIPKDDAGNVLTGRDVTWSSDDPAVLVDANGTVRGVSPGDETVTASSEGRRGTAEIMVVTPPPGPARVVLVGADDIADDGPGAEATARLLDHIPGTIFTTGDNAYSSGSDEDYALHYTPTWGRHKSRTRPAPGNHDYDTDGAAGYFRYFGESAGPTGRGYYSYDVGDWHVISLNSNIDMDVGSPQEQWLRADLSANTRECTIAYWHHPRFSSGSHGGSEDTQPLWLALYEAGAEIVVGGHDHNYQRFAPQDTVGQVDPARGIRQFVVGTGGGGLDDFSSPIANTETYSVDSYGVLKLTLGRGTYTWEFIPEAGKTYTDSGSGTCHR